MEKPPVYVDVSKGKNGYKLQKYSEAVKPRISSKLRNSVVYKMPMEFVVLGENEGDPYYAYDKNHIHATSTIYCPRKQTISQNVVQIQNLYYVFRRNLGTYLHEVFERMIEEEYLQQGKRPPQMEEMLTYTFKAGGEEGVLKGKFDLLYDIYKDDFPSFDMDEPQLIEIPDLFIDLKFTASNVEKWGIKKTYKEQLLIYKILLRKNLDKDVKYASIRHINPMYGGEVRSFFVFGDEPETIEGVTFEPIRETEFFFEDTIERAKHLIHMRNKGLISPNTTRFDECSWCQYKRLCTELADRKISNVDEAQEYFFDEHLTTYEK